MSETRRAWNEWDVPYFAASPAQAHPAVEESTEHFFLRFFDSGVRAADRIRAVLFAVGSVLRGALLTGLLFFGSLILSFGSPPDSGEVLFAIGLGAAVAIGGVALAVLTYRHAGRPMGVTVGEDELEIAFKTFKDPFVVPRSCMRAATVDEARTGLYPNARFPIAGALPEDVFADALDNLPAGPWDDLDPSRRAASPAVIWELPTPARSHAGEYAHDDPDGPGWGSKGKRVDFPMPPRDAFLWSGHGSSLPFLRLRPGDVPNLAIVFHEPRHAPSAPWWFDLTPLNVRCWPTFRGGRDVRGVLLRVADPAAAEAAFTRWGIFRPVTAEDVLEEGLLIGKPLAGRRALVYAGIVLGSLALDVLFRLLR